MTRTKLISKICVAPVKEIASRLTGPELLQKVAEMGEASKAEKARACGYVSSGPDGKERINFSSFYEALAVASGVPLEAARERKPVALSYRTRVLTTGAILIGPRYVEQLGLTPGDAVSLDVSEGRLLACPT